MNPKNFEVIVIGSGTSAYYAATRLNKGGKSVAVIDGREFGGTCALRGCQPKKYLVANAEAVAMSKQLLGQGIDNAPKTNWQALQALKNEFLDGIPEGEVEEFKEAGITTISGYAKLTGPNEVTVNEQVLTADRIVLATGATPRRANIPGSEHVQISDYFLSMPELPKRILFIGGGYISFEFAHVAAVAGSEVTILHRSAQPLKAFDADMVSPILEASQGLGIKVITNETPTKIEKTSDGLIVHGNSGSTYPVDLVIESTGRTPNLSVLEGDQANVETSPKGIVVNEFLQSPTNPAIYAIGDCAATPFQLATTADEEGKIAARNILEGNVQKFDHSVVPTSVFTIPNLATVGLTETQAEKQGLDYRVNKGTTTSWPSSKRIGEKHSGYKVLISKKDDTIIGAHIVRHNASEVINAFGLAIKFGIKAHELADFMWAYPTYTSDLKYMVR
jgi:glutathione reductase (NADPH)